MDFDAFGSIVKSSDEETGAFPDEFGGSENDLLFSTKERDASIGLDCFGFRYYDAVLGKFTSSDPVRDGGNWYAYCANNPINAIDPLGLSKQDQLDSTKVQGEAYKIYGTIQKMHRKLEDDLKNGRIKTKVELEKRFGYLKTRATLFKNRIKRAMQLYKDYIGGSWRDSLGDDFQVDTDQLIDLNIKLNHFSNDLVSAYDKNTINEAYDDINNAFGGLSDMLDRQYNAAETTATIGKYAGYTALLLSGTGALAGGAIRGAASGTALKSALVEGGKFTATTGAFMAGGKGVDVVAESLGANEEERQVTQAVYMVALPVVLQGAKCLPEFGATGKGEAGLYGVQTHGGKGYSIGYAFKNGYNFRVDYGYIGTKGVPKSVEWLEGKLGGKIRLPHYHLPGPGGSRHRPFQSKSNDTSFWSRFFRTPAQKQAFKDAPPKSE